MMLETRDFGAFTQPLCLGAPPKNGITTGPATPLLPLWMCDAVGVAMPVQLSLKQTLPVPELSVTLAVPLPFGSPLGVSDLPVIDTVSVFVAAYADTVSESAASSASEISASFFMRRSSRPRGRQVHRTKVVGPRPSPAASTSA